MRRICANMQVAQDQKSQKELKHMKRPTVAVLYLCTGVYQVFWKDFYPNFKELFLPETDKTFFVFTDAPTIDYEGEPDVRRIPQKALQHHAAL